MSQISRSEAVWRLKKLEEDAADRGDKAATMCYVKAYNAIMSCKVIPSGRKTAQGGISAEKGSCPAK